LGRVIHISSILGLASKEARNAYSATKTALIGLARPARWTWGPFGVTVNCMRPGYSPPICPARRFRPINGTPFPPAPRWAAGVSPRS